MKVNQLSKIKILCLFCIALLTFSCTNNEPQIGEFEDLQSNNVDINIVLVEDKYVLPKNFHPEDFDVQLYLDELTKEEKLILEENYMLIQFGLENDLLDKIFNSTPDLGHFSTINLDELFNEKEQLSFLTYQQPEAEKRWFDCMLTGVVSGPWHQYRCCYWEFGYCVLAWR